MYLEKIRRDTKEFSCATCRFFVKDERQCRRYPQGAIVLQSYWCGEYKGD